MPREGGIERREGLLVQADEQLRRGGGGEDLVKEDLQGRVGDGLQAERGLAHLADAHAQRLDVLGAKIRVVREAGLEFVNRLRGDAGGQDLVQADEGVMVALEARDARLDAQAGFGGRGDGGQARERRQPAVGLVAGDGFGSVHGKSPRCSCSPPGRAVGCL